MVKVGGFVGLEVFGVVLARFVPLLDDDEEDALRGLCAAGKTGS